MNIKIGNYLKLLRVHHYIKNLLIFVPLICSGQLFYKEKFADTFVCFISFCLLSSAVYIFNDIHDLEKDRKHPVKCKRPLASGKIKKKNAEILMVLLIFLSFFCNSYVLHFESTMLLFVYLIMNLGYSLRLKNIPIVDVSILVLGFVIRVVCGAIVSEVFISNWLYLTVFAVSFYLALGKRKKELEKIENGETRSVLKEYPSRFLDQGMIMFLTLANAFYALWSVDAHVKRNYDGHYLIFTIPIVVLITLKYSFTLEKNSDGDPVEVLLHDKILLFMCVLYVLVMFSIMYL